MDIADLGLPARQPFLPPAKPAAFGGDPSLRELLKRCSPGTYEAACRFRATGGCEHLPVVVRGILERFVAPGLRAKLRLTGKDLRLVEDLGVDSLTMIEVVSLAEEVFQVSIENDDLGRLHTLGDITGFVECRVRRLPRTGQAPPPFADLRPAEGAP
jgi:3-hydroxyacyl-[acyl-carrier-protein] dehydratase